MNEFGFLFNLCLAEASSAAPAAGGGGGVDPTAQMTQMIMMFVCVGLVFYLLILRPESRRRKERESTLNALKTKDKVVTIGGLLGTVINVDKDEVTLLVDPNKDIKLKFRRSAIESIMRPAEAKEEEKEAATAGKEKK